MCIGSRKSGFGRLSNPADSSLSATTRNRVKSLRKLAFNREVEVYFRYGGRAPFAVVLCCMLAALGDQLVRRGRSVLFTTCQMLVQELLKAKRDLRMERWIK